MHMSRVSYQETPFSKFVVCIFPRSKRYPVEKYKLKRCSCELNALQLFDMAKLKLLRGKLAFTLLAKYIGTKFDSNSWELRHKMTFWGE